MSIRCGSKITLAALLTVLVACKAPSSSRVSDAGGDDYHLENIPPSAVEKVKSILSSAEKGADFPPAPRRSISISDTITQATSFSVNLSFNLLGIALGQDIEQTFGMKYVSGLVIIRQTDGVQNVLTAAGELNWSDGYPIVAMCTYTASAEYGFLTKSRVKIRMVGGGSEHKEISELKVDQVSKLFSVEKGQTVMDLRKTCAQAFKNKVRNSVVADLTGLIAATAGYDKDAQLGEFEKAEQAALYGPSVRGIVYGHAALGDQKWNVDKANVWRQPGTNTLVIEGHVHKWQTLAYAKNIYYQYSYNTETGEMLNDHVADPSAAALVNMIVAPVYAEYRDKTKGCGRTQEAIDIAMMKKLHQEGKPDPDPCAVKPSVEAPKAGAAPAAKAAPESSAQPASTNPPPAVAAAPAATPAASDKPGSAAPSMSTGSSPAAKDCSAANDDGLNCEQAGLIPGEIKEQWGGKWQCVDGCAKML